MISDSIPWKDELVRVAARLEKRRTQRRWTERSSYLLERDVMNGAFAVRRLIESGRVSDALTRRTWTIERHPSVRPRPDQWTRHEYWENYDLDRSAPITLSTRLLCNQIMHSWNWFIHVDESGVLLGVLVSSDHDRGKCLYALPLDVLVEVFASVGSEEVTSMRLLVDKNGERVWRVLDSHDRRAT